MATALGETYEVGGIRMPRPFRALRLGLPNELYYRMEQIGWDGRPRPARERRAVDNSNWPDALDALADTFLGPVFQGPIG